MLKDIHTEKKMLKNYIICQKVQLSSQLLEGVICVSVILMKIECGSNDRLWKIIELIIRLNCNQISGKWFWKGMVKHIPLLLLCVHLVNGIAHNGCCDFTTEDWLQYLNLSQWLMCTHLTRTGWYQAFGSPKRHLRMDPLLRNIGKRPTLDLKN